MKRVVEAAIIDSTALGLQYFSKRLRVIEDPVRLLREIAAWAAEQADDLSRERGAAQNGGG